MTEQNKREAELLDKLEELSSDSEVDMYSVATLNAYFEECKDVIVGLLEEIQQYRAIGTVKEIKIREAQFARLSEGYLSDLTLLREYQSIGTVDELQNAVKEEDILKFYYCKSEDSYLVGIRIDNFYYAHWDGKRFVFNMSRYLPWGEHIVDHDTLWKEHTYPSEPKEIDFSSWLNGFIKKECGGTIEELQALKEKSVAKEPKGNDGCTCPNCNTFNEVFMKRKNTVGKDIVNCWHCGQAVLLDWE